jgi:hypothetical protein
MDALQPDLFQDLQADLNVQEFRAHKNQNSRKADETDNALYQGLYATSLSRLHDLSVVALLKILRLFRALETAELTR